jgi:hypothetical protein
MASAVRSASLEGIVAIGSGGVGRTHGVWLRRAAFRKRSSSLQEVKACGGSRDPSANARWISSVLTYRTRARSNAAITTSRACSRTIRPVLRPAICRASLSIELGMRCARCEAQSQSMAQRVLARPLLRGPRARTRAAARVTPVRGNLPLTRHGRSDRGLGSCSMRRLHLPERMAKANTRATAVRINEIHASRFKGSAHDVQGCATRLTCAAFELMHRNRPDTRLFSKLLLSPADKAPGSSALRGSDAHARRLPCAKKFFNSPLDL